MIRLIVGLLGLVSIALLVMLALSCGAAWRAVGGTWSAKCGARNQGSQDGR
jgi:hypothetical protein